ncbi:MAG TPA: bifunctional phosphoglucose/phosphomannose isomerase [Syntrophomonas sp.]|jgi:glucose/mannose-6-phosphate isomerase|nr:bifunctional phosphoglucose/phosphomannose isomerase [Syntrophomonas sp.]
MDKLNVETMMEYLYNLPGQFEECLKFDYSGLKRYRMPGNIIITGLGGSAIGGDIVRTLAWSQAKVPIVVNRDYNMPAFTGGDTLVMVVSYSGNTEETLSAYQQARKAGAQIVCVASGGKLADLAAADGYEVIKVPEGLVPRAATGYLFAPVALALESMGVLQGISAQIEETIAVLKTMREELQPGVGLPQNQARAIARDLKDALPVIWGTAVISEAAALRWKAQINENAKAPAYYNVFPELNHNEIVGFEVPAQLLKQIAVIVLRSPSDSERINKRIAITTNIIQAGVKNIIEVTARGQSFLAQFYSLVYIGDYTSVYLALEYGINPAPVKIIDYLKAELAK